MDAYCPSCGTQRVGALRFCRSCGFDFDQAPPASTSAPTTVAPIAAAAADPKAKPERRGNPVAGIGLLLLIVAVGVAVVLNQKAGPSIPGAATSSDLPPAGQIWFGPSFDSSTFVLAGKFSTVSAKDPVAAVAHLTRSMDGSDLSMRTYFDGDLISALAVRWDGSGEIWGWSPGPLIEAGTWRYELTDVGGNVLASGSITGT